MEVVSEEEASVEEEVEEAISDKIKGHHHSLSHTEHSCIDAKTNLLLNVQTCPGSLNLTGEFI